MDQRQDQKNKLSHPNVVTRHDTIMFSLPLTKGPLDQFVSILSFDLTFLYLCLPSNMDDCLAQFSCAKGRWRRQVADN